MSTFNNLANKSSKTKKHGFHNNFMKVAIHSPILIKTTTSIINQNIADFLLYSGRLRAPRMQLKLFT